MSILADVTKDFRTLSDEELLKITANALAFSAQDRKEWQLLYYQPVSPTSRLIHTSTETFIGAGGGNRCVPLDAPVLMADGSWKQLGDVRVGDYVIGTDAYGEKGSPSRVVNTFRSGVQEVFRIAFSDGTSFRATADHYIPLYLGSGRKTTKGHKKIPHKRRLGDYIGRASTPNVSKRISAIQPQDIRYQEVGGEVWDIDMYVLGLLIGDGTFSGALRLSCGDTAVLERFKSLIEKVGCQLVYYGGYDYGVSGTGSNGQNGRPYNFLREKIKQLGLWGHGSYTKFIPRFVFSLPRIFRRKLLEGLIDSDGGKNNFSTCSPQLSRDFEQLVHSLGGKVTTAKRIAIAQNGVTCESYQSYWRLDIPLELSCPHKQSYGARPVDYQRKVIRSIESIGQAECGDIEVDNLGHCYVTEGYTIVSNSSKTDTSLADAVIQATGVIPDSLKDDYPREKIRGPISVRVVCESLTTTLDSVILHKLRYDCWNGVDVQGGERGHWGWIPKACLINGNWRDSWKEAKRSLTVLCRDPDNLDRVLGHSTFQFMGHDQEPEKFASGEFHLVVLDEPPKYAIYRENCTRIMSVGGRMLMAMTWPDDPTIPVDWIFDEWYEKGQGPNKQPHVLWLELNTLQNKNINQEAVAMVAADMNEVEHAARIQGRPIRFANRVHPLFTDHPDHWCFSCHAPVFVKGLACSKCGSEETCEYTHVEDFEINLRWPTVYLLDPHPRKPHMMQWVQVNGNDDYAVIKSFELAETPDKVAEACKKIEREMGLSVAMRLMDPNMGASPSGTKREITWQTEFEEAGLPCELASDSAIGRTRIDEYLKPDAYTKAPRIKWHLTNCPLAIFQMKRFVWDDFKHASDRDQKQTPKPKNDDYPALTRYLMNALPLCSVLKDGHRIAKPLGKRKRGY